MGQIFVWTLRDVLFLVIAGLWGIVWCLIYVPGWWKRLRCKHDGDIGETSTCDAICRKCGKNLGFIGAWKKRNAG